eukprot:4748332-Pyramimonas_sp.AAC.1
MGCPSSSSSFSKSMGGALRFLVVCSLSAADSRRARSLLTTLPTARSAACNSHRAAQEASCPRGSSARRAGVRPSMSSH